MEEARCAECGEDVVDFGLAYRHRKCSHYSHSRCLGDVVNYRYCCVCSGEKEPVVRKESRPTDGIDYILNPGSDSPGFISTLINLKKKESQSPLYIDLLAQKIPLKQIDTKHRMGLEHACKQGVTIDDFLDNGYSWSDLSVFEDMQTRLNDALWALKTTANHLRDWPKRLPIDELRAAGLTTAMIRDDLGLYFPKNGPLQCEGDVDWDIRDCERLQLSAQDTLDMGLYLLQQYEDLVNDVPVGEAAQAEKSMGFTKQLLLSLEDLEDSQPPEEDSQREPLWGEEELPREDPRRRQQQPKRASRTHNAPTQFSNRRRRHHKNKIQEALHARHGFKPSK